MSQCGNNNELALQHGGFCTMWSFVAKSLLSRAHKTNASLACSQSLAFTIHHPPLTARKKRCGSTVLLKWKYKNYALLRKRSYFVKKRSPRLLGLECSYGKIFIPVSGQHISQTGVRRDLGNLASQVNRALSSIVVSAITGNEVAAPRCSAKKLNWKSVQSLTSWPKIKAQIRQLWV